MIRLGGNLNSILERLGEKGLEIVEGQAIDFVEGGVLGRIKAFMEGEEAYLEMIANFAGLKASGLVQILANNAGGKALAGLLAFAGKETQSVTVVAGEASKILLSQAGASSFMQYGGGGTGVHKVAFSITKTGAFAGGVSAANRSVTHGMGVTPKAVFFVPLGSPFGAIPIFNLLSMTSTIFTFNAETKNNFTGEIEVLWVAFS